MASSSYAKEFKAKRFPTLPLSSRENGAREIEK